jgi:alkylation response protein AidB-like acyl-CoA dehydrogenase
VATLMNERVALGGGVRERGEGPIELLLDTWRKRPRQGDAVDKPLRDRVTRLWIRAEVLRLTNLRARDAAKSGTPGPEGSVGKVMAAELNKALGEAALDLLGPEGMLLDDGYPMKRPDRAALSGTDPQKIFLRMRAQSIEGGTSEVMRNILGERVLGLPKEPAVDRDVPWSQTLRSS